MSLRAEDIVAKLALVSVSLNEAQAKELSRRVSSLEAAVEYYFTNSQVFEKMTVQGPTHGVPAAVQAAPKNSPSSPDKARTDPFDQSLQELGVPIESIALLKSRFDSSVDASRYYFDHNEDVRHLAQSSAASSLPRPPPAAASAADSVSLTAVAITMERICPRCNRRVDMDRMYSLNSCSHFVCVHCLCTLSSTSLGTRSEYPKCPKVDCGRIISHEEICQFLDLGSEFRIVTSSEARDIKSKSSAVAQNQLARVQGETRSEEDAIADLERRETSKIKVAVVTMIAFIVKVMANEDHCTVAAFNEDYLPIVSLGSKRQAVAALAACANHCAGGTHMYDASIKGVGHFVITADASRPWVLVILTDGDDSGSRATLEAAAEILKTFNRFSDNFVFVIGLGKDINPHSLKRLCSLSNSCFLRAEDTEALEPLFQLIALQVREGVAIDSASVEREGAKNVYDRVCRLRRAVAIARKDVDILLLVDVSGSMNVS